MASHPVQQLTVERYLDLERSVPERHEFIDGAMVAMSDGSPPHSLIGMNVSAFLKGEKRGSGCAMFSPDLKVCLDRRRMIAYPDVTEVCGEPEFLDAKRDVIRNPTMVVEALSPSTEDCDRGKKATFYRLLPSLRSSCSLARNPSSWSITGGCPMGRGRLSTTRTWNPPSTCDQLASSSQSP